MNNETQKITLPKEVEDEINEIHEYATKPNWDLPNEEVDPIPEIVFERTRMFLASIGNCSVFYIFPLKTEGIQVEYEDEESNLYFEVEIHVDGIKIFTMKNNTTVYLNLRENAKSLTSLH